ncbi:MAG: hypothetical protein JWL77_6211 [Chthonomonadaceae bacterium]|nr:hypothetical protein [Chthonomonadaceae bacterium]
MDFIERIFHISLDVDGGGGALEGLLLLIIVGVLTTVLGIAWNRRRAGRSLPTLPLEPLSTRDRMSYDGRDISD